MRGAASTELIHKLPRVPMMELATSSPSSLQVAALSNALTCKRKAPFVPPRRAAYLGLKFSKNLSFSTDFCAFSRNASTRHYRRISIRVCSILLYKWSFSISHVAKENFQLLLGFKKRVLCSFFLSFFFGGGLGFIT